MNKLIFVVLLMFISSCQKEFKEGPEATHAHSTVESYYTCSMHPEIKETKAGKCPICHMNLTKVEVEIDEPGTNKSEIVPVKTSYQCKDFPDVTSETADVCPLDGTPMVKVKAPSMAGMNIAKVKLRKAQLSHFKPHYFPVTTMSMTKNIRLLGSVLQSEDKESNIPARISGRVEKVYVKSTGSFISLGDPVIDLYSPQLITAGEEYLIARRSFQKDKSKDFKEMMLQSEERLKLWGIKKFQYEGWFKKGSIPKKITIYSPATGIVRSRNAIVGKYFKEGQNFFELSDLSDVWVEMDVYEQDSGLVSLGQSVEMKFSAQPGEILKGEIDFVAPVLSSTSRTLKIRTTVKNLNGKLKPGMISDATLKIELEGMPLVVPRSAIIDTGKRKVVWVKVSDKQFQARVILTGQESEGYVEIKDGLMENEQVVMEGNFLLDAQAQLFGGYIDMSTSTGHQH